MLASILFLEGKGSLLENETVSHSLQSPGCKLFQSASLNRVSLVHCSLTYQWMQKVPVSWPRLTHFSLSHSVKTCDDDMKFIAECKEWATSLRYVGRHLCCLCPPSYSFFFWPMFSTELKHSL